MSLPVRTGTGFGIAVGQAVLLGFLALVSFFIGMDYLRTGSVNSPMGAGEGLCCLTIAFILMFIVAGGSGLNIFNAFSVSRRTKSKSSLRAFYIFLFYPIAAISFVLPSIDDLFFTSMIFGLPVFVLGMVLLPFASFTLMREAFRISKREYVVSYCTYCKFPFRRESTTIEGMCPRCGAYNHFKPGEGDQQPPPAQAAQQQQVHRAVPIEGSPGSSVQWDKQGEEKLQGDSPEDWSYQGSREHSGPSDPNDYYDRRW